MKIHVLSAVFFGAVLFMVGPAAAQQPATPAPNPLDVIPDAMPFNTPYGAPISLQKAEAALAAAEAEATKRGWQMNMAVVDSGGSLISFKRMDGAQLASISIAEHKARTAVKYRRNTKIFENAVQTGTLYVLSLDDVIASRGGIPLIEDGKIIGAIGCSGGAGSQDEATCIAGAATINK
jgi:glc operon protein GlcG